MLTFYFILFFSKTIEHLHAINNNNSNNRKENAQNKKRGKIIEANFLMG